MLVGEAAGVLQIQINVHKKEKHIFLEKIVI